MAPASQIRRRLEIALGELIIARVPTIDAIRFVSTGTEAVMC